MSFRELAMAKSDLGSKPDISRSFESNDCFLQILVKDLNELPEEHYIRPYLPSNSTTLSEIHFLPNGEAIDNPSNRTEILHIGLKAMSEYINAMSEDNTLKTDLIYGRSDPQMASVAKRVGFTCIDPTDSGSEIMYVTPDNLIKAYNKLEEEGVLEKIRNRYMLLKNQKVSI